MRAYIFYEWALSVMLHREDKVNLQDYKHQDYNLFFVPCFTPLDLDEMLKLSIQRGLNKKKIIFSDPVVDKNFK